MNRAAMVIGATLAMGSAGPWYDRVFGCNQHQTVVAVYGGPPPPPDGGTVVAPYGAPQPPPDAGARTAAPLYGAPPMAPTDAGQKRN